MSVSLTRTEVTGVEPITLEEMKGHLRVDFDNDNDLISGLIVAARERAESLTGRSIVKSKWLYSLSNFPYSLNSSNGINLSAPSRSNVYSWVAGFVEGQAIVLPRAPLVSIQSVTYLADGTNPTVYTTIQPSGYVVDSGSEPARLYPSYNTYWPLAIAAPKAVQIAYTAGYDEVPEQIKVAIRLMTAYWYEHREDQDVTPKVAETILASYKTSICGIAGAL